MIDGTRMLATLLAIGAGAWVGGLVTVTLVVVTSKLVNTPDRVSMFRRFGRAFAVFFGATALFVVFPALSLATLQPGALTASILVLAFALLAATAGGIFQARRMTALRAAADVEGRREVASEHTAANAVALRRNAVAAAVIRSLLVGGYVALLALAVVLAAVV